MDEQSPRERTAKGQRTRERILDAAVALLAARGYEGTTMRDIAAAAGCSLGLAYHYFAGKDAIVLALYSRLAADLETQVRALPPAPLAERFDQAVAANLALLAPYREAMTAMFGPALNPHSAVSILGENTAAVRNRIAAVFTLVATGATDAPPAPQAAQVGTLLYGLHLASVFYWLQDGSPDQRATAELRAFLRETLALAGPLLALPIAAETLGRLVRVINPVLGGPA